MCDKFWERLQHLGVPLHLQQVVKATYTIVCVKVQIVDDKYGEVLSNTCVKQECPLSPTYLGYALINWDIFKRDLRGFSVFISHNACHYPLR